MAALTDLIAVLEGEVQLGETLLHNLAAQKEAILVWDSSALLSHIEKKEHLVRLLGEMEEQRQAAVRQLLRAYGPQEAEGGSTLKILLTQLPPTPQKAALDHLHQRAWQIYNRLRAREKHLASLMGALLHHISEALGAMTPPSMPLYGGKGTLAVARPAPGLVQEKM